MKITKRILSFLMVLVLLFSSVTVAYAAEYQDVSKKHWAKADIEWATAQGLMNGTGAGKFSPEGSAERAMLVTILYRSAGEPAVSGNTPFTDLKQAWYKKAVLWAYQNGIVNGTSATTFGPSAKITREQLATILYRYTQNMLKYNVSVSGSLSAFPDQGKVSSYAKAGMLWANAVGLVNGNLKGNVSYLEPKGKATRAQLAAIFHRFDTYQEANKPEPTPTPTPTPTPDPEPTYATVPDFVGKTKAEATAAAAAAGIQLVFNNEPVYNPAYGDQVVLRQLTAAQSQVDPGTAVVVYLNVAPTLYTVPDFSGMTEEEAVAAAAAAEGQFQVVFIDGTYDENKEPDTVIDQNPAAGQQRPAGVTVTLSLNVEPPYVEPEPDASLIFRVAAYNVRHFGHGSGVNYEVFAEEINAIDPDIIGLQEIENGSNRTNKDNQMQKIAEAAGYPYYYFGKSIDYEGGGYGHGILSKYPITKSETVKFKAQTDEERTVERHEIYVDLTNDSVDNGKTLVFYNTHLAYCGEDENNNNIVKSQPKQMAEIMAMMDRDTYPILVGDTNIAPLDFRNVVDTERYTPLNGGKTLTVTTDTYPQGNASYIPIDNIILSDNIGYRSTQTQPNGLTVNRTDISDHNLIYADIWLKEDPAITPLLPSQQKEVPDVSGMSKAEAKATLEAAGFAVALAEGSSEGNDGIVMEQKPAAGCVVEAGKTVTLTVKVIYRVPDLYGKTVAEAKTILAGIGLTVTFAEGSLSEDAATVTAQSPAAGTEVEKGSAVTLTAKQVTLVPNVIGQTPAAAKAALEAKGFKVAFTKGSDTESADAKVTLQTPAANSEYVSGETVTLTGRVLYPEYLTVASYDVKRFNLEASTGKVDYDPFVEEISALNPDIIGFQAVDEGTTPNGYQTKIIAEKLGYSYYAYAPALDPHNGGTFGNSILSRFPILETSGGLFETQDGETRGYVRAVIDVQGVPVTVYNVMFTNSTESAPRYAQLKQMTDLMAKDEFPILMGNLNMHPGKLNGKLDLTAYTPLNGGKGLDQVYATLTSNKETTYVSNIIITDQLAPVTDTDHPTGFHVSEELNCWHRMVYTYVRMKNAQPTQNEPGAPKVPDLTGLTVAEARARAEAAGFVFALAPGADESANATVSVQTPAAYGVADTGTTITVNTRVLYGDYITVASYDIQKNQNYATLAATIKKADPDIISIQGYDHGTTTVSGACQLEELKKELGADYEYILCGDAHSYKGGYLSNGILSKYPITKSEHGRFTDQTTETRGWNRAEINVGGTTIAVYNVKLAHGEGAALDELREKQLAEILAKMDQDEFPVLMGNLSTDATMLEGLLDMWHYTPLNGGKSLENICYTAFNGEEKTSSSNIILTDEFEYMTDETAAPYGLYLCPDATTQHRLIYAYIRLKDAVLPENAKFIDVPDFTGMTQLAATAAAAANGLTPTFRLGFDQNYIEKVSAQSTPAGTRQPRGKSIELTIGLKLADPADYQGYLTVASYNVQRAAGGSEYDEIAAEIKAVGADVVGIQEVMNGIDGSKDYGNQIQKLADEVGFEYSAFGRAIDRPGGGEYGHGIISRYPIIKSEVFAFTDQYGENRSYERHEIYIDTTDDGQENGYTIAFYNTHLCLDPDKSTQNAQLAEILAAMEADTLPAVLVGDLNAEPIHLKDTIDASTCTSLNGGKDPNVNAITCHNGKPIDHIILTDDWDHFEYDNGLGIMVIESEWSDHNMLYTYIKLKS